MTGIVEETAGELATMTGSGGGVRYIAPELIGGGNALQTLDSDTFSFGTLMLECITEKMRFFLPSRSSCGC